MHQNREKTKTFADAIGRKAMSSALGVGEKAISNAVVRGKFPPGWFFILSGLATERGIECPQELFGARQPAQTRTARASA